MTDGLTIGPALSRAKWRDAIAARQLATFVALAFVFSWYPWIIAIARGQTSGPNPLGPLIAVLVVAGIANGWPGVRDLLGRMVRARIGLRWYAVIFGLPVVMCAWAIAIMVAFGKTPALPATAAWRELPERFIFILLFIGLGEEPGWRGLALPRLQKQHSPFIASLILAPVWALWHVPLMGNEFPAAIIPAFLISLLGGTADPDLAFPSHERKRFRPDAFSRDGEHGRRRARVPALPGTNVRSGLVRLRGALAHLWIRSRRIFEVYRVRFAFG